MPLKLARMQGYISERHEAYVDDDDGPEWSSRKYATEEDARTALGEALGVGEF